MPINNQQYRRDIGVFHNKLRVIKCYYNFLDFQMYYSVRTIDFESLLMILDLLALFHFESLAYYVVIYLQCMRRVNFNSLTFSLIFQVLIFQSHSYSYRCLTELNRDVEKNPGHNSKPCQSFSVCRWNPNPIQDDSKKPPYQFFFYNLLQT